ncbi:predicted protein [Histoplasma capsulatum var. duboisii H88]|uniref:Predicted protein n=2 Tax=Ajellomyces capsulatus (strain H88) TaxID=544711 RepID=F0UNH5_AJEC8|nr:predicted protein [Histoplasma capsulatum var. duboisii H88]
MLEGWKNPGLSGLPTNRGFRNHSGRVLETAGYPGLGLGPHNSQQRAGRARCVSAYQCVKKWAQAKHRLGEINDLPKAVKCEKPYGVNRTRREASAFLPGQVPPSILAFPRTFHVVKMDLRDRNGAMLWPSCANSMPEPSLSIRIRLAA